MLSFGLDGSSLEHRRALRRAVLALTGVLAFVVGLPLAAQDAGVCDVGPYRSLDHLLGEWRVVENGRLVGTSRIEKLEGGCLIAEVRVLTDGTSGRTYSAFDPVEGVWQRFGVSNGGAVVRSSGALEGRVLVVRSQRTIAGESTAWSERWTPEADGRVRVELGQESAEAGGADTRFVRIYVPAGEPVERPSAPTAVETTALPPDSGGAELEPAPAEAGATTDETAPASGGDVKSEPLEPARSRASERPAVQAAPEPTAGQVASEQPEQPAAPEQPAPETPAPAGEVTAQSPRATDARNIERVAMASPMVLRLPLGPVENLPDGYAWISRGTAPYLCEGVTIERVEVSMRERRGQLVLQVEFAVHAVQQNRRVDLNVQLARAGEGENETVVATGEASGRAGRGLPEQIEHGSVAVTVPLPIGREAFDAAVADGERPELVITLAVGG